MQRFGDSPVTWEKKMDYLKLLEHSFETDKLHRDRDGLTRFEFLSESIFDFTTYDSAIDRLFASKALEVCEALSNGTTFDYIKDEENYKWYLLMCNMPFFAGRLNWGTSIRGAWWDRKIQTLESCGLFEGENQVLTLSFTPEQWEAFIRALLEFAAPPQTDKGD